MAEAARTVGHYVSDCLAERHPYDVQKGFRGRPLRDAGKVFCGFLPCSIDILLQSLSDATVGDMERAKAVHYLYAYSASQETKIELVSKDAASALVAILNRKPVLSLLEQRCFLLLWSLSVIPHGCFSVIFGGGLAAALARIREGRCDKDGADMDSMATAMRMVLQVTCDYAGLRWLLDPTDCEEHILARVEYPCGVRATAEDVFGTLAVFFANEPLITRTAYNAMSTAAQLTSLPAGVYACLANLNGIVDCFAGQLCAVAAAHEKTELSKELLYFTERLCETLWNIALAEEGLVALEQRRVPASLFSLFGTLRHDISLSMLPLHRALMGAISTIYKLTEVKLSGMEPLADGTIRVVALLSYLHTLNCFIAEERAKGKADLFNATATARSVTLSLRLAMELKAARVASRNFFDNLNGADAEASSQLCRHIYQGTRWEAELGLL